MGRRRVAAWLLSLPLMVVGSQVAHGLAYRWVYPQVPVRLTELLASGHGYMGSPAYVPILLSLVFAAELLGLGWVVARAVRRRRQRPVPAWAFALTPLLSFSLQEFLERWLSGAPSPWLMIMSPTFRVGLLLQLPFSLIAYVVAWLLLRAAERTGRILRGACPRPGSVGVTLGWVLVRALPLHVGGLVGGHSGRGPPPFAGDLT